MLIQFLPSPTISAVCHIPPKLQLDVSAIVNIPGDVLIAYPNVAGQHGPRRCGTSNCHRIGVPDLLLNIYSPIMPEPAVVAPRATEVRVRSMSDLGRCDHSGVGYASIADAHVVDGNFHIIPGLE